MTGRKWTALLVGLALMAGGASVLLWVKANQQLGLPGVRTVAAGTPSGLAIVLPERVRQYGSTNLPPTDIELATLPKDTSIGARIYAGPSGPEIMLRVVMMGADRTSIHKPEFCVESQGWKITAREWAGVPIDWPRPYELPVRKFTAAMVWQPPGGGQPQQLAGVYAFWFVSGERLTASHWARMGYLSWDLLRTGKLPRWAYVSCFATCAPGQEDALFDRMKQFIAAAVPDFQLTAPMPNMAAATTNGIAGVSP